MAKMMHSALLASTLIPLSALTMGACAPVAGEVLDGDDMTATEFQALHGPGLSSVHMMPMQTESSPGAQSLITTSAPAGAKLIYRGGPVIQNVKVFAIYWNSSVPDQATLNSFYSTITSSAYFDMLTEYNTTSPAQTIGHGTLGGSVIDTGAPTGTSISDAQVQAEITRLINAGKVPANDGNNYYAVHFPAGVNITAPDGSRSCVQFCAYHGTYLRNGSNVYYGVMPDLSGGCAGGCGGSTKVNNTTSVSSHELVEAVTDAAVGLATVIGPPLAWYDATFGEIGDICNAQQAQVAGFTVQKQFSNKFNDCIATAPVTPPPGTCAHDKCVTGAKLVKTCDPCVTKVCNADAFCCNTTWDSVCKGEVKSICGITCP